MSTDPNRVWALVIPSTGFLSVSPDDLRYFHTHFVGKSLLKGWSGPPKHTILGASKPLNDFVSWHVAAPLVSIRAKDVIAKIAPEVEILSFDSLKGRPYFVLNVTVVVDVADFERSDIQWLSGVDEGLARSIVLRGDVDSFPPVFKLAKLGSQVYVSHAMARELAHSKLTGFSLLHPSTNIAKRVMLGGPLDEYCD